MWLTMGYKFKKYLLSNMLWNRGKGLILDTSPHYIIDYMV